MEGTKSFSLYEVSLHTSKKDCWVAIHGKVYDVTAFLEEHPGGEDALLEAAAKGDATADFDDVGHSSTATAMMSGYLIGVLGAGDSGDGAGSSRSVKEEKQERFVAAKPSQVQQQSPSAIMNLIPLLIIIAAFAAWYYLNKVKI